MASTQPPGTTISLIGTKLYFSKRTVRLGNAVYLIRNIIGFRVTEANRRKGIKNKKLIPFEFIIFMCVVGLVLVIREVELAWGIGIIILIILALIFNELGPKTYEIIIREYVLEVSFTSGDKANIFLINERNVASDEFFLDQVVSRLYQVLDSNDERTYVVNLEDKSITIDQSGSSIGVGYSENITVSEIGGTINNRQQ
ncbi:hypothetical protein [Microcoleus sp. S13C4]|uniref:hypothetical protein n=1 Tax=Microcoleus sp. S13C4 TaxID=3055410 RepID=UPI002FD067CF